MNQLMPQLARGELDIVVGRSIRQYDDPQLQTETLYTEPINFVARPDHALTEKA
jgi:DNA-binding transcriptional LysR family regulator